MSPEIRNGVLYGADDLVARWVQRQCGGDKVETPCVALGVGGSQGLIAGIIFFNHRTGADIQCAVAAITPRAAKPRVMAQCFAYAFNQLGLNRVTAEIELKNLRSTKLAEGLGFVREGVKRKAAPDGGHVAVYGLLKKDFRLRKYLP